MSEPAALRPRVHANVVRSLAARILRGDFQPGQTLPNEAALQLEFGVSRTALREAVRVLAAKGMLVSRPRVGTAVRERAAWNRLDAEVLAWSFAVAPDLAFVESLIEARRVIEPAAAAFAAMRARPE
ncbi:MAG: FadR/GntR family transcriptional regulator, partial [Acetobacteraceae bacterium]